MSKRMHKRNKMKARQLRSGTSPYKRYGKRPYRYPDALYAWEREHGAREAGINLRAQGNEVTKDRNRKLSQARAATRPRGAWG